MCIMARQDTTSYVQEKITEALLMLFHRHGIDELAVSDIVKAAGVGRASFYRHFTGKRDVLEKHLQRLIREWGREFEATNDITRFVETLLMHYYRHRDVYLLLYRQNLSSLIYEQIRWAMQMDSAQSPIERYQKASFAGLIFGTIDEWLRGGMQETPREMLRLTEQPANHPSAAPPS